MDDESLREPPFLFLVNFYQGYHGFISVHTLTPDTIRLEHISHLVEYLEALVLLILQVEGRSVETAILIQSIVSLYCRTA